MPIDRSKTTSRRTAADIKAERGLDLQRLAEAEYDFCRAGIAQYNDTLYKIRTWNMGFTAAVLLAFITNGSQIAGRPLVPHSANYDIILLIAHLCVTFCFWFMDASKKSMQRKYIEGSRQIESFLRKEKNTVFLGPSISLRFSRKERRHAVEAIKSISDDDIQLFYILPIVFVILLVFVDISINHNQYKNIFDIFIKKLNSDGGYLSAFIVYVMLFSLACFIWLMSGRWAKPWPIPSRADQEYTPNTPPCGVFLWRDALRIRKMIIRRINAKLGDVPAHSKYGIVPFYPEYADKAEGGNILLFVDRPHVTMDREYLRRRAEILRQNGYKILRISINLEKLGIFRKKLPIWRKKTFQMISFCLHNDTEKFGEIVPIKIPKSTDNDAELTELNVWQVILNERGLIPAVAKSEEFDAFFSKLFEIMKWQEDWLTKIGPRKKAKPKSWFRRPIRALLRSNQKTSERQK